MRAKITGLTASTIAFNEIEVSGRKLIIHGTEEVTVDLDKASKLNEIAVLEGCKLIKCVEIKETKSAIETIQQGLKDGTITVTAISKEPVVSVTEDIEDSIPSKSTKEEGKRGRPKGSKNKPIKRAESTEENRRAVVVSENGNPVETKSAKDARNYTAETDITKASLQAMADMEEEERKQTEQERQPRNEESLDISEQMGRKATIHTGKSAIQVNIQNSVVPESKTARETDAFIDREDLTIKDKLDKDKNMFLDENSKEDDDFLEM